VTGSLGSRPEDAWRTGAARGFESTISRRSELSAIFTRVVSLARRIPGVSLGSYNCSEAIANADWIDSSPRPHNHRRVTSVIERGILDLTILRESSRGASSFRGERERRRWGEEGQKEKRREPVALVVENLISIPSIQQLYQSLIFDKG